MFRRAAAAEAADGATLALCARGILKLAFADSVARADSAFIDSQLSRVAEVESADQWVDRYNESVREVDAGHVDKAETLFREVHDKSPDPALVLQAQKSLQGIRNWRARARAAGRR